MKEEIKIIQDEDGHFVEYDDTYDIIIHCTSQEEQDNVLEKLNREECPDAINRQAAIDAIKHAQVNFNVESEIDFTKHKREVQEIIENVLGAQEKALKELPPVTAEKVGEWMYGENFETGRDGWFCSKCGHFEFWDYSLDMESARRNLPNICPDCGAKMQEVEHEAGD